MKQIIIALSGRKCAGKNTVAEYIAEYFAQQKLIVCQCSFADTLKGFCIETLGLSPEQCYGTDDQKNSPTSYLWENVGDLFIRWKFAGCKWVSLDKDHPAKSEQLSRADFWKSFSDGFLDYGGRINIPELKTGPMTGREIMQLFGTELIRETFGNVWAEATIRRIANMKCGPNGDTPNVAIITDNRFPNEVKSVLDQPLGFVIRLTRAPFDGDEHPSEAALDGFNWDRDKCFVLDNGNMTLEEQRCSVVPILKQIQGVTNVVY